MIKFFLSLSSTDKISIVSIIISLIATIVSITISVFALVQTTKINNDSKAPNIVIFLDYVQFNSSFDYFFVLKNFGQTGATIKSIKVTTEMHLDKHINRMPLEYLSNHYIAPNQSITDVCYFNKPYKNIFIELIYIYRGKEYKNKFDLNLDALSKNIVSKRKSNKLSPSEAIELATQELIRKFI